VRKVGYLPEIISIYFKFVHLSDHVTFSFSDELTNGVGSRPSGKIKFVRLPRDFGTAVALWLTFYQKSCTARFRNDSVKYCNKEGR